MNQSRLVNNTAARDDGWSHHSSGRITALIAPKTAGPIHAADTSIHGRTRALEGTRERYREDASVRNGRAIRVSRDAAGVFAIARAPPARPFFARRGRFESSCLD